MRLVSNTKVIKSVSSVICTKAGIWPSGRRRLKLQRWLGSNRSAPSLLVLTVLRSDQWSATMYELNREQSAAAAYAHDTHSSAPPRQSVLSRLAPSAAASSSRKREAVVKDKWANYSTAKQLGFDDEETSKSSYEIEQELRGRAGEPGAWEVVAEPVTQAGWVEGQAKGGKRKLGDYALGEEEDHEDFKFQHRDKRPVNDVWEEEEWDPRRAFGGLRVRVKEERQFGERRSGSRDAEGSVTEVKREEPEGGLKREDWTGRLELKPEGGKEVIGNGKAKEKGRDELVFDRNEGGWIKAEPEENGHSVTALVSGDRGEQTGDEPSSGDRGPSKAVPEQSTDPALELAPPEDTTLDIKPDIGTSSPATNSLFKKRRPPPAARKK
jgi:WW domain-binding protein 4